MRTLTPAELAAEQAAATTQAPAKTKVARAPKSATPKVDRIRKQQAALAAKKPAKAKVARDPNAPRVKRIGDTKADVSRYVTVKAASGSTSLDCGDELASKLRGLTIDEVYERAAKLLREPEATLRARYKHLNPGMQRMNLGNRMRGATAD